MKFWNVNFPELYARHLCRHSQYGNNVIHIVALVGIYLGLLGVVYQLGYLLCWSAGHPHPETAAWYAVLAIPIPWLVLLAFNIPTRLLAVVLVFLGLFFPLFYLLPNLPALVCSFLPESSRPGPLVIAPLSIVLDLVLVQLCYKLQNYGHKLYTLERDMTEFNRKYPKGLPMFVLLSLYEASILLNYLVFDRPSWSTPSDARAETLPTSTAALSGAAVAPASDTQPVPEGQGVSIR